MERNDKDCRTGSRGSVLLGSHDNIYAPGGEGVMYTKQYSIMLYYIYIGFDLMCLTIKLSYHAIARLLAGFKFVSIPETFYIH